MGTLYLLEELNKETLYPIILLFYVEALSSPPPSRIQLCINKSSNYQNRAKVKFFFFFVKYFISTCGKGHSQMAALISKPPDNCFIIIFLKKILRNCFITKITQSSQQTKQQMRLLIKIVKCFCTIFQISQKTKLFPRKSKGKKKIKQQKAQIYKFYSKGNKARTHSQISWQRT